MTFPEKSPLDSTIPDPPPSTSASASHNYPYTPPSTSSSPHSHPLDTDAAALAQMGYTQDLKRNYTWFSLLGVGFSLTNSWWGISAALITGINSGGPVQIVYGLILFALISTCVGVSLSELASALPNAGGQYFVSMGFGFGVCVLGLGFCSFVC
jgi:hypothetical protein